MYKRTKIHSLIMLFSFPYLFCFWLVFVIFTCDMYEVWINNCCVARMWYIIDWKRSINPVKIKIFDSILVLESGSKTSSFGAFLCFLRPAPQAAYNIYREHHLKSVSMQDFVFFALPTVVVICSIVFLFSNEYYPVVKTMQQGVSLQFSMWLLAFVFGSSASTTLSNVMLKHFSAVSLSVYRNLGLPVMVVVGVTFFGDRVNLISWNVKY